MQVLFQGQINPESIIGKILSLLVLLFKEQYNIKKDTNRVEVLS